MSVTYFAGDRDRGEMIIDVPNPGYGAIDFDDGVDEHRVIPIVGARLGLFLAAITTAVLEDAAPNLTGIIGARCTISARQARQLLPSLQRAIILATAGTDRYEIVVTDPDVDEPEPLCVNCNEGSPYHQQVTISARCTDHGHTPFGQFDGTSWEKAIARHNADAPYREMRRTNRRAEIANPEFERIHPS